MTDSKYKTQIEWSQRVQELEAEVSENYIRRLRLEEKLRKAQEALEYYETMMPGDDHFGDIARQALDAIREWNWPTEKGNGCTHIMARFDTGYCPGCKTYFEQRGGRWIK